MLKLYSVALLVACVPGEAVAQLSRTIDFSEVSGGITVTSEGAEVTLQPVADGDDMIDVSAAIRIPGYQTLIVQQGVITRAGYGRWVGIGKLSKNDPAPTVLLAGFTGGAHCCATLKAIVPDAGRLRVLEFDPINGGPEERFPVDVDHDGTVDIVRQDDSFRYQFASGAGSYSPPVIYNIYRGNIVDVSAQLSFRPLWEKFAAETRAGCANQKDDDRNGACAAYVAAAARLGRFQEAFREAIKLSNRSGNIVLPSGCTAVPVAGECPEGKELTFYTFETALRWFLHSRGYVD